MNPTILNREFKHPADGWYQIEPKGEFPNTPSRVVQVIDDEAAQSIVNRFNADADAGKLSHGHEMLIDHEHFKHQADKETIAYGWLAKLQNRADGIYGQVHWSDTGRRAVDGGDYRFFSTEYDPADLKVLNDGKNKRVRPLKLDGLTLTNDPNNKGGRPITNRGATNIPVPRHHNFDSDEEFLAAAKRNQEAVAANKAAKLKADPFPTPALNKWFEAVVAIQNSAESHANIAIDFSFAWELARQQFPDLYDAAFGAAEQSTAMDAIDPEKASVQVAALANRISNAAHLRDLRFGWNFVREKLPALYNRAATPSEMILNRQQEKQDSQAIQKKAAHLFSEFAFAEKAASGLSFSQAWHHVTNRHPALVGLAGGSLTLDEACEQEPELRTRLM